MYKLKILVLGPCQSGKTILANFLADATETSSGDYYPTQGARILEFESGPLNVGGQNAPAEVELWDCSGSDKFESCWPAMMKDTQGIVFVCNPDQTNYDKDLDKFYTYFVQMQGLKDVQCVVFVLHKPKTFHAETIHLSHLFTKIQLVDANLDEDGESVRSNFNRFLNRLINAAHERRDQEELTIMNS